jgi:hypothetical protein
MTNNHNLRDAEGRRIARRKFLVATGFAGIAAVGGYGPARAEASGTGFRLVSAADRQRGFTVAALQAHNAMADHLNQAGHLVRDLFGVSDFMCQSSGEKHSVLEQLWIGGHGSVRVWVEIHQAGRGDQPVHVRLRVGNGFRFNIRTISFDLPEFTARAPADTRVLDSCCGGRGYAWRAGHGDDGEDYYRYSALVVFYDARSGAGVSVDFFDDRLRQSGCSWHIDGNVCRPRVHSYLNLSKGRQTTLDFYVRSYARGMPDIALDEYRELRLAPTMKRYGMVESSALKTESPWACTGWPFPDLVKQVAQAKSLGARGYIQWAPPDGKGFYEPFPERLAWFKQLKAASRVGIPLGVLIDPRFSPRVDQSAAAWKLDQRFLPALVVPMASQATLAQSYLLKMRDNLAENGVSMAFWDTGGMAYPSFTPEGYLTLLEQWRRRGIRIMPEVSRDYSAWITGVALNWGLPHGNDDRPHFTFQRPPRCQVLKRVTPRAKMFRGGVLRPLWGQGSRYWWDAFAGDPATVMVLTTGAYAAKPAELETWAKEHARAAGGRENGN